jgi:hypothetical protein
MAYVLARNTPGIHKSNTDGPASASGATELVQWYELAYTSTGAQEWVYLPDAMFPVGVTLSGSGAWVATVEATDSPPDVVKAGSAVAYAWPLGTQTATNASATLTGATAVRANVTTVGTNVKLSVRA